MPMASFLPFPCPDFHGEKTPAFSIVAGQRQKMAVRETILFLTQRFPKLSREEAYHVTQVVDGTKGIHGMIPKSIFVGQ